jgi:hypothetical protein
MPRITGPQLVSYTEVVYSSVVATLTSASLTWLVGDVIVVIATSASNATIGNPTASGLLFTTQQSNIAASTCSMRGATAIAASNGAQVISVTISTGQAGMGIWQWRGSDGVGASAEQHTATKTVGLTPVDTHSAYCWTSAAKNAGTAVDSLTPTPTNTRESAQFVGQYTVYSGELQDQAGAGATNFGTTGAAVTGPFTIIPIEVLGSAPAIISTSPHVRFRKDAF